MTNVERRIGAPDTRPLPRAERRHGAPDTRDSEKPRRGVFRVNYQEAGQPQSALVAAFSDVEAANFMGVANQSGVQVTKALYPVEVAGLDTAHKAMAPLPINFAPPQPAKQFSDAEMARLRALLGKGAYTGPERRHGAPDTRPLPQVNRRA
jgi:hypothetical protein